MKSFCDKKTKDRSRCPAGKPEQQTEQFIVGEKNRHKMVKKHKGGGDYL
jgi:hypothetical protein